MPSAAPEPDEESRRDSWIKVLLLAVALVLVAGYAATIGGVGEVFRSIAAPLGGTLPLLSGLVLLTAACAAMMLVRRRRSEPTAITASGDPLAGLMDRKELRTELAAQVAVHQEVGRQMALHLIDIDRFHVVNEVLGEAAGDALLRNVAERLQQLVGEANRLARIGDDEFAVIQPEAGGFRHAEIFARRIQDILKQCCADLPRHARPGASIGIAVAPEHGDNPETLLHRASQALRDAKKAGGAFRIYAREMEASVEARLQMETAIAKGLDEGWFELRFQPQYDLGSRRLTGFEGLVRMNHPELGELLPCIFLPTAEESGLMQPLGDWIVREALAVAADWPEHLKLSLNLSSAQFRQGDVAQSVLQGLTASGFLGTRLRLEIHEAVLADAAAREQLGRLKGRGVTIVVDDFGMDSSSLQALAGSGCDAVKLDRSFVLRIGEDAETEGFVRSLIATAQAFGLTVLAEGVERPEQVQFLLSNDCRNVQGYLFGRPTQVRDLAAIVAKDLRNATGEERRTAAAASAPAAQSASIAARRMSR
jgi:diguanylate cyclase (GGDEF)-like protein